LPGINLVNKGYHLADGIYPSWATFVKIVHNPTDEKCKRFAKEKEAVRKDVEWAFGVLLFGTLLELGAQRECGM
jgi:hypothetical protein